ncbi:APC family permease [Olsenella profusa]|uniref:APC family permease n=1 Tax=Olsenella profusa TaxID=138595 RepID=A0ABS2F0L9_9ACTN|nr:APC family permease [Olsenella profusa]MBM6774420.1 APC family permease [Olsenella profusa]
MSLRDTIEGARKEAEGIAAGMPKKADESGADEGDKKGFVRSSAAKARPAREAAASVRTASKPKDQGILGTSSETKEEKRERRRRERERNDMRTRAYDIVLRSIPEYRQIEKRFWIIVGVGFALAVVSLIAAYAFGSQPDMSTWQGIFSVVTLVLAYVLIIGGLIYDFVKRRPYRKRAEAQVRGMTDKRIAELFEQESRAALERQAKKAEKKAAKKAEKNGK